MHWSPLLLIIYPILCSDVVLTDSPIKHIVLLVLGEKRLFDTDQDLENRSYDSFLGELNRDNSSTQEEHYNISPNGTRIYAEMSDRLVSYFDPGHEIDEVTEQIYGSKTPSNLSNPVMSGFASNAARLAYNLGIDQNLAMDEVMDYHTATTLPVLYGLAREYAVIDRWFASVPGPTFPNRHFIHCATSGGHTKNYLSVLGYPMRTIYDSLNENRRSWMAYSEGRFPSLLLYRHLRRPSNLAKMKPFKRFLRDAAAGRLPDFSLYVFQCTSR